MVEMAFVLGLLVMLLVGVVTSAIAFGQKNSIENAAREASRYAATFPFDTADPTGWLTTVKDVAQAAAQGDLADTVPGQYICVAYINPPVTQSLEVNGGTPSEPDTQCFADGLPADEPRVQVVTGREAEIQAVFFTATIDIDAPAAARYERN
jgi:hypothetical protein